MRGSIMTLELYLAFVAATTVLILLPGPSVLLTVAHAMAYGSRRALLTVAGTSTAIVLQLAVTALGMTSMLLVLSEWFEVLRWAGVAYLVYLGIQLWRAKPVEADSAASLGASQGALFWQGFVVSATNPKSLFFYAAFFPQFVDPGAPPAPQLALLCGSFLVIATVLTAGYALLAERAGTWFRGRRGHLVRNRLTGTLMIGAGLGLALARRG
jgi:threonine/homoserine/homoserine lactone efflux protein